MTGAALSRDSFMPQQPAGMGAGMLLALFAHGLLVVALTFSVSWRSSTPAAVEAELWAAVPQIAAPAPPPPTPPPQPEPVPVKPPPAPVPKPTPVQEAVPDAQIAIEKARREELKREEAKREEAKRELAKREAAKRELARAEAERKKLAEEAKQEEERTEAQRQANLKRMLGQAGASPNATTPGTAAQSAGPSPGLAGRIKARILPKIVFVQAVEGDPIATVEVRVAPDGTILARRITKSSGVKAWDEAVLSAVDKTDILPRDQDGTIPPVILLDFNPRAR